MQAEPEIQPQILDETYPLEEVLVWGEPGCEALLGQLLPKSKSLFFSYYDVTEARREFRNMQALIEKEGIKVIRVKDAMARLLVTNDIPDLPATIQELEDLLFQRADEYYETFRERKMNDLATEGIKHELDDIYIQVKADIKKILREDVDVYGESAAIRLNYLLSLSHELPLANIFYGRDQSQALANRIVLSVLKWGIRKPEVEVYRQALAALGYAEETIGIERGTLEGGDVAIFDETCYIGVGARTSLSAVKNLCRKIGPLLEKHGLQVVAVINKRHAEEAATFAAPTDEHMHIMHLDMFWIPLGKNLVMAYGAEIDRREVIRISSNSGMIITEELGNFRNFLGERGIEILEITKTEQEDFATNLLNLGNNTVIMALSKNERVIAELKRRGFRVMSAELNKLVNGYGAIHCLTAPVKRTII